MTVINIRGTSGSGKSTAVKKFLNEVKSKTPFPEESFSKTPDKIYGYYCMVDSVRWPVVVLGSYERPSGGCDGISPLSKVFEDVLKKHNESVHVIFEGLLVSRSKGRVIDLWDSLGQKDLHIIHLTTSLEDCLKGIGERRIKKGNTDPLNPARTVDTYNRVMQITSDLETLGIPTHYLSRDLVLPKIQELLEAE